MYNDYGEAIAKSYDYSAAKFDVRIIAGSTLPVNRWAYVAELKELMQLGVIDDIALLSETDIKNKEQIAQRKSVYSQLQGQLSSSEETIKNLSGTIETLERQLVQAGIKGKVMQASMEVSKKKEEIKSSMNKDYVETEAKQKVLRHSMANQADNMMSKGKMQMEQQIAQENNLENKE